MRYRELDSLRGIAAISVLFSHFLLIFTSLGFIDYLNITPLRFIKDGHENVIFFFVLSGFVLSLPFFTKKKFNYRVFVIKRFFRIYLPYVAALILAFISYSIFYKSGISNSSFTVFFNRVWSIKPNFLLVIQHLVLIDNFKDYAFDPVLWSLSMELRISLFFPLLMFFVTKYGWKTNLLIAVMLSICSELLNKAFHITDAYPVSTNYFYTLHYSAFFIIGALLAKYRLRIISYYKNFNLNSRYLIAVSGLFVYAYSGLFDEILKHIFSIQGNWTLLVGDWGNAVGISILIIISLSSYKISNFLTWKPLKILGQISYSLYLIHTVILFSCIHFFYGRLSVGVSEVIAFVLSFITAGLLYYFVEEPSIKLGKKIGNKIKTNDKIDSKIA